ncbi:MAG: type II toxin-antitoxin system HicA family toxin [Paludibacteraceae bacterium]|nr:type II toxin-antitoxin system HicA family toxin [Paludibacteraceae bacterium]
MKYSELLKILTPLGWQIKRHGANHDIYYNPRIPGRQIPIPRHQSEEVKPKTLQSILKASGIK